MPLPKADRVAFAVNDAGIAVTMHLIPGGCDGHRHLVRISIDLNHA